MLFLILLFVSISATTSTMMASHNNLKQKVNCFNLASIKLSLIKISCVDVAQQTILNAAINFLLR